VAKAGKRRKAREVVLQSLYEGEFSDRHWDEILTEQIQRRDSGDDTAEYARALLQKVHGHVAELDKLIADLVENWEPSRLSLIDRNILRFALAELLYFSDVPKRVIINEAIEIANKYSSSDAGKFVNGVLDRAADEHKRED